MITLKVRYDMITLKVRLFPQRFVVVATICSVTLLG